MAFVLAMSCAAPAYAYIDPSVMTYTIQAVAGVAVALSAVLGVALRRGRKLLVRLLDIDENAKREFEPDVYRVSAECEGPAHAVAAGESLARRAISSSPDEPADVVPGASADVPPDELADVVPGASADASSGMSASVPHDEPVDASSGECAGEHGSATTDGLSETAASEGEGSASEPGAKASSRGFIDRRPYKPNWKTRAAFGFIVAFFLVFTIYYVAPLEIVAGSANSLVYSLGDVWWVPLLPCLGIVAAITLVLSLLRGRAFNVALALVFGVGVSAYVQALFLNAGLPAANGASIVWSDYMFMQVCSSVVWAAIIVGCVVLSLHNRVRMQGVVAVVSVFLAIVQSVGLASLAVAPSASNAGTEGKVVMTEDQLYTVNPDHNVVVFILDTYDTAYLRRVLKMNPDLLEDLTGFTNYENATSATIPTRFAIPEMLTGQMPSFDEPYSTYTANRYARSSFLDQIHDANYSIGLYTDSLRISALSDEEQRQVTDKTVNMHALSNSMMDYGGTLYSLYQMGQYRDALWPFKWAFWYYTDQVNNAMVVYDAASPADETIYVMDDVRYYDRLRDIGLSVEDDGYDGAFRFIHLLGSHYPFNYDEEANYIGEDASDVFRQSQGAIHIVSEYINQLKELGVYENTTIIITADHGYWTITLDPIEETSTPIMFVKGEQSSEADAEPIAVDEKPVSHLDLQATVLDAMGLDYSEYAEREFWEGYSMFGEIPADRKRYYLTTDSEPDLTEVQFREYLIDGNALDWENWSETGRTIDAQE